MTFFTGYLAQGTGSSSFVENSASGYTRQAASFSSLQSGRTALTSGLTFANSNNAVLVTQRALYDAPTVGNLICWWSLGTPVAVPANGTDTLSTGSAPLLFSSLSSAGATNSYVLLAGTSIGVTADNNKIYAGTNLELVNGIISVAALGGGNGSVGPAGPAGPAGPTGATGATGAAGSTGGSPVVLPAGTAATLSATPRLTKISDSSGTATTFTLPTMAAVSAASGNGQLYIVKYTPTSAAATQTIAAASGTTIDGSASVTLPAANDAVSLIPDTTNNLWSRV